MIDYSDIDAKLEEYSEAFDFYFEHGEMPPSMPEEDCLGRYMKEVIDNNPQIDGTDNIWFEVLKEELISYFTVLLEQFRKIHVEAMNELKLISRFRSAPIEEKRKMWQEVTNAIKTGYSKFEVNLPGYTAQFRTAEREAVFSALTADWENACKKNLENRQQQMLEHSKQQFEQMCKGCGPKDYEDRKRVENYVHHFPQLKEIVDLIGRDKDPIKDEQDSVIYKFLPVSIAKNSSVEEIDRVEAGDRLERVLPVEFSMPDDLFFKRYVTKELQQFSSQGKDKPKKVEDHRKDPRLTKGPIVVGIDTSRSMSGRPQKIAFSLLKQLLRMAKKQKRSCFLITFSIRAKTLDLAKPRNWGNLDNFLENSFSGGTCGEEMLNEAIRMLQGKTYEMADVLIISDFEFNIPSKNTKEKIEKEQLLGTRFYGLKIGNRSRDHYASVLDKMWKV